MYVRVNTIEGSPGRSDDLTTHIQEQTLPQLQEMEGFKGFVALGDRQSGKVLGVSFWQSEEALRANEEAVSDVRSKAAETADGIGGGVGEGHGGRVPGVAFWQSGEALRANEEAVSGVRSKAAETADGIVVGVEEYE